MQPLRTSCYAIARNLAAVSVCALLLSGAFGVSVAAEPAAAAKAACLPDGAGFVRARLTGSVQAEIDWRNVELECSGATRPSGGVRLRFSHQFGKPGQRLALVFGIPALREGEAGRALPVNVTLILEGTGQFFGTRGDDKCLIDSVQQHPIVDGPTRKRQYQVTASGFCTQPARAVAGAGAVLITRFDLSGRVDYSEEDTSADRTLATTD
jgi:hypothetical protein